METTVNTINLRVKRVVSTFKKIEVFANLVGLSHSRISNILRGPSKPGFDFIQSMVEKIPDLNERWLITGTGTMWKKDSPNYVAEPLAGYENKDVICKEFITEIFHLKEEVKYYQKTVEVISKQTDVIVNDHIRLSEENEQLKDKLKTFEN